MSTDEIHALFDKAAKTVDSLATTVDSIGTKVDSLATTVDSIGTKVDSLATTVDSLGTRVDAFAANAEAERKKAAAQREAADKRAEAQREAADKRAEAQREAADKRAEAQREADREEHKERLVAEAEERKARRKQVDKEMKALRELFGGMGNSMGDITEEFFYNSLSARPILKGMRFDKVLPNRERTRNGLTGEFDLILLNSHDVFLNEVKFKARERDLELLVGKQARVFRKLYPEYGNLHLHLGLASFHFDESLIAKCLASGVTVLQRVGNVLEAQYPPGKSLKGQPILLH